MNKLAGMRIEQTQTEKSTLFTSFKASIDLSSIDIVMSDLLATNVSFSKLSEKLLRQSYIYDCDISFYVIHPLFKSEIMRI